MSVGECLWVLVIVSVVVLVLSVEWRIVSFVACTISIFVCIFQRVNCKQAWEKPGADLQSLL